MVENESNGTKARKSMIGPLPIHRVSLAQAIGLVESAVLRETGPLHLVTANTQFLGRARKNPEFADVVGKAGLVVPDGVPLVWLCWLGGLPPVTRITGHDLVHATSALAASQGYSVGFLGAAPGVAETAAQALSNLYPGLRVAGIFRGSFGTDGRGITEWDETGLTEDIRQASPDILYVALGCPKQEMWITRHQTPAGIPVAIGIGGVLDVLAGRFKRAPQWMQRNGLEWLYRLGQNPKRLWSRYLLQDVPTLGASALRAVRSRYMRNGRGE